MVLSIQINWIVSASFPLEIEFTILMRIDTESFAAFKSCSFKQKLARTAEITNDFCQSDGFPIYQCWQIIFSDNFVKDWSASRHSEIHHQAVTLDYLANSRVSNDSVLPFCPSLSKPASNKSSSPEKEIKETLSNSFKDFKITF